MPNPLSNPIIVVSLLPSLQVLLMMVLGSKLQLLIKCLTQVDSKVQQPVILWIKGYFL